MARIYAACVEANGNVAFLDERGNKVGASHSPTQGGKAICADFNPSLNLGVVTTERGIVLIWNEFGGCKFSWSDPQSNPIVSARWMGDNLFVQRKNGNATMRRVNGAVLKYLN